MANKSLVSSLVDAQTAELTRLRAENEALREALKPLVFSEMGKDEDEGAPFTTQDVWETIYKDRVQDWFDFGEIETARQLLGETK